MKVIASEREDARLFYDHYRAKVASLGEDQASHSDSKKLE
jgi:hypothetical protein